MGSRSPVDMSALSARRAVLPLLAFAAFMALLGLVADVYRVSVYGGTIRWALPVCFAGLFVVVATVSNIRRE
ncbi:MAG: hypothetical protein AAFQ43_11415, partial [Bacteroidota bacterium]